MISHRCRYKGRGSVLIRVFTSSIVRWAAARVILAISSLFCFQSSPPLFYHSTRIGINAIQSVLDELAAGRPEKAIVAVEKRREGLTRTSWSWLEALASFPH